MLTIEIRYIIQYLSFTMMTENCFSHVYIRTSRFTGNDLNLDAKLLRWALLQNVIFHLMTDMVF